MTGSTRPIAGDVGTDNRIDCDDGHYWVRLATAGAIRAEGFAMRNCLTQGFYVRCALSEGPLENGLWSLRNPSGGSVALAELSAEYDDMCLVQFRGPQNAMASAFAYRQLHDLAGFFAGEGRTLSFKYMLSEPALVANGRTYRWDRVPKDHRLPDHEERLEARRRAHEEAKRRREAAERMRDNPPPIPDGVPPGGAIFVSADPARMAAIGGFELDLTEWRDDDAEGNRIGAMRRRAVPVEYAPQYEWGGPTVPMGDIIQRALDRREYTIRREARPDNVWKVSLKYELGGGHAPEFEIHGCHMFRDDVPVDVAAFVRQGQNVIRYRRNRDGTWSIILHSFNGLEHYGHRCRFEGDTPEGEFDQNGDVAWRTEVERIVGPSAAERFSREDEGSRDIDHAYRNNPAFRANLQRAARRHSYGRLL